MPGGRSFSPPDYYEILQVSPNADAELIHVSYQRLIDHANARRTTGDTTALERLRLLGDAFAVLSDPENRKRYDRHRTLSTHDSTDQEVVSLIPANTNAKRKRADCRRVTASSFTLTCIVICTLLG